MKRMSRLVAMFFVIATMTSAFVGCGGSTGLHYPDYPTANTDVESWEQWEDYDPSQIEIDWYVDYSTFAWTGGDESIVSNVIKEKTGITINFMTPVNDDGTQLNTLIAGDKLPDVITILANGAERVQLAEEEYVYPINELSKRWAPRLMDRIDSDITKYFKASDGMLYGTRRQCLRMRQAQRKPRAHSSEKRCKHTKAFTLKRRESRPTTTAKSVLCWTRPLSLAKTT